jgi:hydrogenase maturation protease
LPLPSHVTVRFCPQIDLDLIDYLVTAERVIFCDATKIGEVIGTVTVHNWQATASWSRQPYCCHGIGLSDLVRITSELEPHVRQREIHLVGVEASVLDKFGVELSGDVCAALPKATAAVLRLLGAGDELISFAQEVTRQVRPPTVRDVTASWK